jgi:hypothetical protein
MLTPLVLGAEGGMGMRVVTVNDVLDGHVALDIECLDRIYLNGYVPALQTSAQVAAFLTRHLGFPFPSPALFKQLGDRFRRSVRAFADAGDLPWVTFDKHQNKLEVMGPHLARQAATGRSGVAAVGVAQEFQRVWTAYERQTRTGAPSTASPRLTGVSPATTSTCGPSTSARALSRCAPTSRTRPRFGSTGTSGSSAKLPTPGSALPSCPTGLPPAMTRRRCRRSVTGWDRATSTCSPAVAVAAAAALWRGGP